MGVAFGLVLLGIAVAVVAQTSRAEQQRHHVVLEQLARKLRGRVAHSSVNDVRIHGVAVRFAFVLRGAGSSHHWWTEIDCSPPPAYPLSLNVRRREQHESVVDIMLGDARFDAAFVVEAAPTDVVRLLLDQDIRSLLLSLPDLATLTTEGEGPSRVVRLSIPDTIEQLDAAHGMIDIVARLAARVPEAYVQADANIPTPRIGSPFRESVDTRERRAAHQLRVIEVEHVDRLRLARLLDDGKGWWVVLVFFVLIGVLVLVL